jgi:hypothetical protein
MFVPFEEMPAHSRVWVYQSSRALSSEEVIAIESDLQRFVDQWQAHRKDLKGSAAVMLNTFIVLMVDEQFHTATGCSIDSSVHFIKELEQRYQLSLFDRSRVAFHVDDTLMFAALPELKSKIEKGEIKKDTITFNNLVQSKAELESGWMLPAEQTWLARYF